MTLIQASGVSVHYGGRRVLFDIDFSITKGEIVTIVGPNGSGKTTLLRALLGVVPPRRGTVARARGLRVGYVPQRLHIDPGLPLPVRRFLSLPTRRSATEIAAVLARVGVPDVAGQNMTTLSGGQFQRVLLARALLMEPDILMLDEPTAGLDQPGVASFYRLIDDMRHETGCAVLSVSHDLHVVMSASDRVVCINGHICCEGTPSVVRAAPEYRALFGMGTGGALALFQHQHDHEHDHQKDDTPHAG
ncbi:metal ABC transporter ATP-binding protein [Roseinatronobacter alkalisoli]|uniref:Metal ABC transporter ATP-binding protein n=1 Tax=Roseinatronobacter alkalisoli TaxID=3028235 RepID=A0ABT5T5Q8_9RHOB|nr:metal ABC transporter ATP-binding protein [Roseinatronobacter sp. HJB301]MDD7970436.1 metal ABC transporter ATP-binding protein [Roseinatronobacter sp. HJB301]